MTNLSLTQSGFSEFYENKKIAFLLATGFEERDFLHAQKFFRQLNALIRLVSPNHGLVTSWNEQSWGHNYAIDLPLKQALASDFSACVIPGGQRNADKLALTEHSKRFINGFLLSGKPVLVLNESTSLISRFDIMKGQDPEQNLPLNAEQTDLKSEEGYLSLYEDNTMVEIHDEQRCNLDLALERALCITKNASHHRDAA